jgi:signal-transduction protein with cAMP-binding, CBS, and nucleotidyltransferase domain
MLLKSMLKKLLKNKVKDVMSKTDRDKKIDNIKFCENNLRKNISLLLDQGKSMEEIVGYNTSLLVCLASSESIKRKQS